VGMVVLIAQGTIASTICQKTPRGPCASRPPPRAPRLGPRCAAMPRHTLPTPESGQRNPASQPRQPEPANRPRQLINVRVRRTPRGSSRVDAQRLGPPRSCRPPPLHTPAHLCEAQLEVAHLAEVMNVGRVEHAVPRPAEVASRHAAHEERRPRLLLAVALLVLVVVLLLLRSSVEGWHGNVGGGEGAL